MLTRAGYPTQTINLGRPQIEVPLPGFDRFFDAEQSARGSSSRLGDLVFGPRSRFQGRAAGPGAGRPGQSVAAATFRVRALPPDWIDPAGGGPTPR